MPRFANLYSGGTSRVLLLYLLCGAAETRASFFGASAALLRGTGLTAEPVMPFNATADFSWANEPANILVGQYVAMCLAIKDQHHDIREWLQHHHSLGVGRFYIYVPSLLACLPPTTTMPALACSKTLLLFLGLVMSAGFVENMAELAPMPLPLLIPCI